MRNTFLTTLADIAEQDPNVWLLCGDLGFSVLEPFAARIPGRYINVGVAEQNMAGIAAGIALSGKTVFIYSIGNFPTLRCLEQLRNDVCHHGADVKVVSVGGGFAYGNLGYTHHAIEDVAVMSALPGMEVFVPSDPAETRSATRLIAASRRPSYLRLSRTGEPNLVDAEPTDVRAPRFLRHGDDVTLLASGPIASECIVASDALAASGISAGVASVACIKPLDHAFIREIAGRTKLIVTVEEHVLHGGVHAAVAASLAADPRRPPVVGLAIPDATGKSLAGTREALLARAGLAPTAIVQRIREAFAAL